MVKYISETSRLRWILPASSSPWQEFRELGPIVKPPYAAPRTDRIASPSAGSLETWGAALPPWQATFKESGSSPGYFEGGGVPTSTENDHLPPHKVASSF